MADNGAGVFLLFPRRRLLAVERDDAPYHWPGKLQWKKRWKLIPEKLEGEADESSLLLYIPF